MNAAHPQLKWLWISLLVVVFDQTTKQVAELLLPRHQAVNVIPYFDWYLTYNKGAAFSFLADAGGWQRWMFTLIAIVISGIIVQWMYKLPREETMTAVSLSLILGGAIGNLIDRVYLGHVIDYIQVWLGSYPWPAFNIADAAIFVGAAMLILSSFTTFGKTSNDQHP
jgi:signal peptidase II